MQHHHATAAKRLKAARATVIVHATFGARATVVELLIALC
jgi:hypothetical protein